MRVELVQLGLEARVALGRLVGRFQLQNERHQASRRRSARHKGRNGRSRRGRCGSCSAWVGSNYPLAISSRAASSACLDELADQRGIFFAGSRFDAGRYIDDRRAGERDGFGDIAGIQAAGQHEAHLAAQVRKQVPVEGEGRCRREARQPAARSLGVEQDEVGGAVIGRGAVGVTFALDADRLDDRTAGPPTDFGRALRRFPP